MLVRRMAFANVRDNACQISQTSQPKTVSTVAVGRVLAVCTFGRCILALGNTISCGVSQLLMCDTLTAKCLNIAGKGLSRI